MIKLLEPEISSKAKEYVNDCLDTGWLSYVGPYVKKLEDRVKNYLGANAAVAMSHGTGALWLALKCLGIGPGDFVAVPNMTFIATANAVTYTGATPVFIDCDDDLQISIKHLKEANKALKLKAVIPVYMLGNTGNLEELYNLCKPKKVKIIEDAAQALGSKYKDQNIFVGGADYSSGAWATMFSFSFNKLVTAAQGGMITTPNISFGEELKHLSLQAKEDPERYIHDKSGFNMGMSNINAALAYGQLEEINETIKKKRRIRDKYAELLGVENIYYQENSNGWLNAYKSKRPYEVINELCKEADVQVRPLFYPIHLQKSFKDYPYFGGTTAQEKNKHTVCLPSSPGLTDEEIEYVVKLVRGDK